MANEYKKIIYRQKLNASYKKAINCPLHFIDMTKDFMSAFLLNQIIYWLNEEPLEKENEFYVYKSNKNWYQELRLTDEQIRHAEENLCNLRIIKIENDLNNKSFKYYSINWSVFLKLEKIVLTDLIEIPTEPITANINETIVNELLFEDISNIADKPKEKIYPDSWIYISDKLKENLSIISYKTWIESSIADIYEKDNELIIKVVNSFSKGIMEDRYLSLIDNHYKVFKKNNSVFVKIID